jgi:hypothetical protein
MGETVESRIQISVGSSGVNPDALARSLDRLTQSEGGHSEEIVNDRAIHFFRAFPMTRETLCFEPLIAWARDRGYDLRQPNVDVGRWSVGTIEGCEIIAREMGLERILAEDMKPNDVVAFRSRNGAYMLGVCTGEFSVAAAAGKVYVGRYSILHAWKLGK